MSPSAIAGDVAVLVLAGVACFIAYRALELRQVLVDHAYRSRALWTAIGALTLVAFAFAQFDPEISGNPTTYTEAVVAAVFYGFVFIGLYGWLISNANVAVRADYFNRDILFWKKGGRQVILGLIVVSYAASNIPPWWITGLNAVENDILAVFVYGVSAVAIFYGLFVLVVSYRRIMDRRIKAYTLWVVLSLATVLVGIFVAGPLAIIGFVAFLYFMYRAVGALTIRTNTLNPS